MDVIAEIYLSNNRLKSLLLLINVVTNNIRVNTNKINRVVARSYLRKLGLFIVDLRKSLNYFRLQFFRFIFQLKHGQPLIIINKL